MLEGKYYQTLFWVKTQVQCFPNNKHRGLPRDNQIKNKKHLLGCLFTFYHDAALPIYY